ncbi:MAG: GNAT family N-acetyltransferase [Candidatus Obscuribacterales bacterium]|nr:GNAT family N-acetyltransferase [Candidatus Obscuribacterales bacterium]
MRMIAIRSAIFSDSKAMAELLSESKMQNQIILSKNSEYWVYYDGETLVAMVGNEYVDSLALIKSLVVRGEMRGKGIAKDLLQKAIKEALEKKCTNIYAITSTAPEFFEKFGFTEVPQNEAREKLKGLPQVDYFNDQNDWPEKRKTFQYK